MIKDASLELQKRERWLLDLVTRACVSAQERKRRLVDYQIQRAPSLAQELETLYDYFALVLRVRLRTMHPSQINEGHLRDFAELERQMCRLMAQILTPTLRDSTPEAEERLYRFLAEDIDAHLQAGVTAFRRIDAALGRLRAVVDAGQ